MSANERGQPTATWSNHTSYLDAHGIYADVSLLSQEEEIIVVAYFRGSGMATAVCTQAIIKIHTM